MKGMDFLPTDNNNNNNNKIILAWKRKKVFFLLLFPRDVYIIVYRTSRRRDK